MSTQTRHHGRSGSASATKQWLGTTLRNFPWVHLGLGLLGNLMFFVGSVCFFYPEPVKTVGVWLFVVGSFLMLVGSVGQLLVKIERHRTGDG